MSSAVESALREQAPRVLGVLVRRHGDFDRCEDAVQEALLEAHLAWHDVPERPFGWLLTVAERRLVDGLRSDTARARREERQALLERPTLRGDPLVERDDTLALLLLCCHPDLSAPSQIALTLRAVGGLTTDEIARALLVSPTALAQRIVRAKARLRGVAFGEPPEPERGPRLAAVLHVLYLLFTEGHTASSGPDLVRDDLAVEALRLTRRLHAALPQDGEIQGLLALMLLTHARRASRLTADGALVPLAEQDRSRWDATAIAEAVALVESALARGAPGPYQLQAAIAALHAEAPDADATDWPQILALYDLLEGFGPNPVVTLNRAVAVGEVDGPRAGLEALDGLEDELRHGDRHRLDAVRGYLLDKAGEAAAAAAAYARAAGEAATPAERRHLAERASRLSGASPCELAAAVVEREPLTPADAVAHVEHLRRVDDPNGLELEAFLARQVEVEQTHPGPDHDRHHMQLELLDEAELERLPHQRAAAGDGDVLAAGRRASLLDGRFDPVGDVGEARAALALQRLALAVGDDEHRRAERRLLAPRHLAAVGHAPPHHVRAGRCEHLLDHLRVHRLLAAGEPLAIAPGHGVDDPAGDAVERRGLVTADPRPGVVVSAAGVAAVE